MFLSSVSSSSFLFVFLHSCKSKNMFPALQKQKYLATLWFHLVLFSFCTSFSIPTFPQSSWNSLSFLLFHMSLSHLENRFLFSLSSSTCTFSFNPPLFINIHSFSHTRLFFFLFRFVLYSHTNVISFFVLYFHIFPSLSRYIPFFPTHYSFKNIQTPLSCLLTSTTKNTPPNILSVEVFSIFNCLPPTFIFSVLLMLNYILLSCVWISSFSFFLSLSSSSTS